MKTRDITNALLYIDPTFEFGLSGEDYEKIQWFSTSPKPTWRQVLAAHEAVKALAYREARAAAYPPIGDQLDALWTGGEAATEMKAVIDAVKARFPKPEGI
jgi:hypothetical protein